MGTATAQSITPLTTTPYESLRPESPLTRGKGAKASLQQDTLTTVEAAAMLGISPATLRGWKAQRIGPPFIQFSPRCVRYDHRDIQQYVNERRCVPGCDRRRK